MADPNLRGLALRRVAGLSIASGFAYAAQALAMSMLGVGDDEEEAFRDLAAPWQRNSNIIPIDRDEKGHLRFIDLSFLDPYNYWKRPINAILRDQPYEEIAKEIAREAFRHSSEPTSWLARFPRRSPTRRRREAGSSTRLTTPYLSLATS